MNHLRLMVLVFLALLAGCAKPGLRGVRPYVAELGEAQRNISYTSLPPSRNLSRGRWHPTLKQVMEKIQPMAYRTCIDVGAMNCDQIGDVYIVDDSRINAFVDGKHKVSVHTGLLYYAASDEEIAAVLAHEYGHIFADHIRKSQANAGAGLLAGALAGLAVTAATGVNVTQESMEAGANSGGMVFSQEFELESDYYASLILEKAGIDLVHGRNLLIRLARSAQGRTGTGYGMWGEKAKLMATTHPANDFRIARWTSVSRAIEASKRIQRDPNQASYVYENQLRQDARKRLLSGSLIKSNMTRWVSPENGHSGMLTLAKVEHNRKCLRTCVHVSQVDYAQGKSKNSKQWFCKVDGKWEPRKSVSCAQ